MTGAAKSVLVWGIYMAVTGTVIYFIPNVILPLMDFPPTHEPWVRTMAGCVAILGFYYIISARHNLTPFLRATIYGRIAILVSFSVLVIFFDVRWELLLFAIPDQGGALWTYLALRKEAATAAGASVGTGGGA